MLVAAAAEAEEDEPLRSRFSGLPASARVLTLRLRFRCDDAPPLARDALLSARPRAIDVSSPQSPARVASG
jgi:hypothetical protein